MLGQRLFIMRCENKIKELDKKVLKEQDNDIKKSLQNEKKSIEKKKIEMKNKINARIVGGNNA